MDPEIWKLIRSGTRNQDGERTDCEVVQSILAFVPKLEICQGKETEGGDESSKKPTRERDTTDNVGMDPDLGSGPLGKQRKKR